MLLVPRQLQRAGMTGNVPYYGGRFSPAQAYAAAHPTQPPPSATAMGPPTGSGALSRAALPEPGIPGGPNPPAPTARDAQLALQHLLSTGIISEAEFQELQGRVKR